jgi:hypothetical protein
LEKFNWDADRVCELIRSAFAQVYFREKRCTLAELLNNTTAYQGAPKASRRASSAQIEPPDEFFERCDARLAKEMSQ